MHDTNLLEDQPIAWIPTPDVIERSQLTRFMKQVGVTTWAELYEFSIRDVEKFTEEVLKFLDIKFDPPYEKLLDISGGIEFPSWFERGDATQQAETRPVGRVSSENAERGTRNAESVVESRRQQSEPGAVATGSHAGLNITTMCLDRWQTDEMRDQPAVIWEGENGGTKTLSYSQLLENVHACVENLRDLGLSQGDAIGIHLPMLPETVVALLAINRIGAIAVPVFSGYGIEAVASRMEAVRAKTLFTCHSAARRGKSVDMLNVASQAVAQSSSIESVMVVGGKKVSESGIEECVKEYDRLRLEVFAGRRVVVWGVDLDPFATLLSKDDSAEPTSAEDPLIILYTSGTTGKPKGIAHTHGSFPIKAAQDMAFGTDVGRGTRISWYTDIGWMMGPWLIYGALINGATICIYDGAPDYPTPDRMWEFSAKHKVEVLGISPTLVRALASHEGEEIQNPKSKIQNGPGSPPSEGGVAAASADGVVLSSANLDLKQPPRENHPADEASAPLLRKEGSLSGAPFERHDLSSLRMFASTGEPWNPAPWWWLFEKVGNSKLPIINYSGGTEIAGGILMGNPLLPIKPCSFPAPCPGMDVDILDENGKSVKPGQVGELVIKQPWIGMARGFWQERERYLETYWRRFKNIWVHGDWAMRDKDGHWFILGRSDDTLKVAGKRVGPAEVESLLVAHPLVTEAAVIGVPDEKKGTAMVAFCVLSDSSPQSRGDAEQQQAETRAVARVSVDDSLQSELKALVSKDMGKPLAPSKIHFVSALPKTRNAKVMRRVLRSAYLGEDPGDLSALENPQTVTEIQNIHTTR